MKPIATSIALMSRSSAFVLAAANAADVFTEFCARPWTCASGSQAGVVTVERCR